MNKFKIITKLLLLFLPVVVIGLVPRSVFSYSFNFSPTHSAAQAGNQKRYLFWEVSSVEGKAYILGSIHLAREGLYPLSPKIEKAFEEADVLAMELDLSQLDELEVVMKMLPKAMFSDDNTLESSVSFQTYQLAKEKMQSMGMDIRMFNMYQPWFVAVSLTSYALVELGFRPEWGVDMYFSNKAQNEGKPIVGMETVDFQLNLFQGLPYDIQELFLLSSIVEIEGIERHIDMLFDAWKRGDMRRLETILMRSLRQYPELELFYEKVFYLRNKNMALQIEDYLKSGESYFVVVGAGHLVGQQGIIQLLRDKGYAVSQH